MSSKQAPIHSGFGPATTARETLHGIDLRVKLPSSQADTRASAWKRTCSSEAGAAVIVPARTPDKARQALGSILRVEQSRLDLLDPGSIDAFVSEFLASGRPLHMLINNAGIMATPLARDSRGYESQFSANHLGHFQLTARLWPALRNAHGARAVSVSSGAHQRAAMDFADPQFHRRPYDRWEAYGQSKTANVLFAVALDRRGEASGVRAFAVHPGAILTDLSRHMTDEELQGMGCRAMIRLVLSRPENPWPKEAISRRSNKAPLRPSGAPQVLSLPEWGVSIVRMSILRSSSAWFRQQ